MEHGSQVRTQMRSGQHRGDQTPGAGAGAGSTHRRSGETRGDQTLMERGKNTPPKRGDPKRPDPNEEGTRPGEHTAEAGRPGATDPTRQATSSGSTHRRSGETRSNRPHGGEANTTAD